VTVRFLSAVGSYVLALVVLTGCAANKQSHGEKTFESFESTRMHVADAQKNVDNVLAAMGQFQYTGNLNNAFQNYKAAVAQLEKTADDAQRRAQAMRENQAKFVENWQKDVDKIQDPNLKATMEQRREAVRQNFAQVKSAAAEAREAYEPFIRSNKDIVQSLSTNLSPAMIPPLKPKMDQTTADGQVLKAKLAALQKQLDNIAHGQSASGSPTPTS
jgi:chromosome segregation ATPase